MPTTPRQTLNKAERINGKRQTDTLFTRGASRAMSIHPIRMVYSLQQRDDNRQQPQAMIMVSVPKRHFKRAVKRNRIKRQLREAYRHNKHILLNILATHEDKRVLMAFIWTSDELADTSIIEANMKKLLARLSEKIEASACTASAI